MIWITRILSVWLLSVTLLPLIPTGKWYVRWWDFPRFQLAVLLVFALITWLWVALSNPDHKALEPKLWCSALFLACIWQASHVIPFSPIWHKEVRDSGHQQLADSIKIVVANIDYKNLASAEDVIRELDEERADILLVIENNEKWMLQLKPLRDKYSFHFEHVQDEGLGMAIWSQLPLSATETRQLVSERRKSLWTTIMLEEQTTINFVGVHPTPPGLMDSTGPARRDSRVRDAELILVAREIARRQDESWIVAGDFNDVAWSHTTRLFKRISGLRDPRIGRSFMGTYIAQYPPCRCPIDHVFVSSGFTVANLSRKLIPGSDHFAVLATVSLDVPKAGTDPQPEGDDHQEAKEIIEDGKQDAQDRGIESESAS
jgi:endonuclease/exonuclease/phosphatase (EEP) superfamily protein YafD